MKKNPERRYKLDTAKIGTMRLVSAKPNPGARRAPDIENAREIILKLIEAIKRL